MTIFDKINAFYKLANKATKESLGKLFWQSPSKSLNDPSFKDLLKTDPEFVFKYINSGQIRACMFGNCEGENILEFCKTIDGDIAKYLSIGLVKFALSNPTNYGNVKVLGDALKMLIGSLKENGNLGAGNELLNRLHFRIWGGGIPPEWEILSDEEYNRMEAGKEKNPFETND